MELRTLRPGERPALLELLGGWEMGPPWRGRAEDFFRRYVDEAAGFRDEDAWVAARGGRLLACVQIFPRRVRVGGGAEVPLGGIGSVFTRPEARGRGLAGALLARAEAAMRERGLALGMLFAGPVEFYARRGWLPWPFARALYLRAEEPPVRRGGPWIDAFDPARDLDAVRALHAGYSRARAGTLVRDTAAWEASLRVAGNPDEDFRVARRGGAVVAYARHVGLEGHPVLTELGRAEGPEAAEDAAALLDALLERGAWGSAPADPTLEAALAARGVRVQPLPDPGSMLRCLDRPALAAAAGVDLRPGEDDQALLRRILPPERCLFWTADRF